MNGWVLLGKWYSRWTYRSSHRSYGYKWSGLKKIDTWQMKTNKKKMDKRDIWQWKITWQLIWQMKNEKNNHLKMAGFPSHQKKWLLFWQTIATVVRRIPHLPRRFPPPGRFGKNIPSSLGPCGSGMEIRVSVTDHTSCLNRRYIRVFPKNRGKKPKMDGLNNGKTC